MDNKTNFIISAFVALSLYVFLIILFLYYTKNDVVKKIDAVNKITVLQLDVILENEDVIKEKIKIKSGIKNKEIAKKVVKKTTSVSMKQRSNLKSLFANVKTKAKKVRKTKVLNVKKSSISSRFKSKFEKEKKVKNVTLSNLIDNKKSQSSVKKIVLSESKNENDPYFSEIYQMLSSRWNPTVFVDELKAKVLITILNNGEFSFKFIQYSQNNGFNNQLKQFLYDESLNLYPINPNNKTTNIEILFQSKG